MIHQYVKLFLSLYKLNESGVSHQCKLFKSNRCSCPGNIPTPSTLSPKKKIYLIFKARESFPFIHSKNLEKLFGRCFLLPACTSERKAMHASSSNLILFSIILSGK